GVYGDGEAGVGLGVFVRAVDPHVVRQRAQAGKRRPELLRRGLEHLATAEREDGVAAEQCPLVAEGIGDMAARAGSTTPTAPLWGTTRNCRSRPGFGRCLALCS